MESMIIKSQLPITRLAKQLFAIADQSYPHGSSWNLSQYSDDLNHQTSEYQFALINNTIVGFIQYRYLFEEIELYNVVVLPQFRGQGIAQKLLNKVIGSAQEKQVDIFLEVRANNESAQSLYKKAGFIVIGKRKNYYHQPIEDAFIMRKCLNKMKGEN